MRMRTTIAVVTAVGVLFSSAAAADPVPTIPTQLLSPSKVETEGGSKLELPAGFWILPDNQLKRIDRELRGCQDDRTRLGAENKSMRKSLRDINPAWYYLATAVALGFGAGVAYSELR